jgi:hypothetical protein
MINYNFKITIKENIIIIDPTITNTVGINQSKSIFNPQIMEKVAIHSQLAPCI